MKTYQLKFNDKIYQCRENETLLEAFIRQGVELSFSCRKGSCHVCMMQCLDGQLSEDSQKALHAEYIRNNYFLPCSCIPVADMVLASVPPQALIISGVVHSKDYMTESVCRLLIEPAAPLDYRAGQYLRLIRNDGMSRSYSISGMPEDYYLEFYVKRMSNGAFSNWIFDDLKTGDAIDLQGPFGDCFYHDEKGSDVNLVLIGKSTGFAPLTGILRDAISKNHTGKIHAFHLGDNWHDIYNGELLKDLAYGNNQMSFYQGLIGHAYCPDVDHLLGELHSNSSNFNQSVFYMAGSPSWLASLRELLTKYGIDDSRIYSDPYEFNDLRQKAIAGSNAGRRRADSTCTLNTQNNDISPVIDGIWDALDQGRVLSLILQEFYTIVYADERLSAFFHNTTRQRSVEKQFLFLRQKFTGEKVYFGDRPRNAHHWMVITDELFDYRKNILLSCILKHELDEKYIQAWLAMEESFRGDIVKSEPWPKVVNGVEMPLNGYEVMVIDEGTICDGCQDAIYSGQMVRYHVRLGLTYCEHCIGSEVV